MRAGEVPHSIEGGNRERQMTEQSASDYESPVTFRFSNIGPVKDASLQLGRLTVIAGRNNTGKTYITYSLYGFLRTWRHAEAVSDFLLARPALFPGVAGIADKLRKSGRATIPLPASSVQEQQRLLAEEVGNTFSENILPQVFSSRRDNFPESRVAANVNTGAATLLPGYIDVSFGAFAISITYDDDTQVASFSVSDLVNVDAWEDEIAFLYRDFLLGDLFSDPFILSAERFGISLFYRELDFTKNQLVDLLQKLGDEVSRRSVSPYLIIRRTTNRYALPIKDNIDFTRNIPDLPKDGSTLADHKLFDDVKDLIGGYYGNATEDIRFISKARGEGRSFNIPLHLASSSARGLADLYFFLRYAARRGQLLIIDEPESHLDTRNQVLFARMLAGFVKAGLRVLITTHSDYLVKELNNLIMLSRDFSEKEAVAKKLGYKDGEALDPRFVRGYVAEDGGLTECEIGAYGIEMPVFDTTIDDINHAAIELSSRVEEDM